MPIRIANYFQPTSKLLNADQTIGNGDDHAHLEAVARNLQQIDGTHRSLTIYSPETENLTIEFCCSPVDETKSGAEIIDRIANALLPSLMSSVATENKHRYEARIFLMAKKIAVLSTDGILLEAMIQPVKEAFFDTTPIRSDLCIVLSQYGDFPVISIWHSATWQDENQQVMSTSNLVTRLSVDELGEATAELDIRIHADPSVMLPWEITGIVENALCALQNILRSRHIKITPCTNETRIQLDYLSMKGDPAEFGKATGMSSGTLSQPSGCGQGSLNDARKKSLFDAHEPKNAIIKAGIPYRFTTPSNVSEQAIVINSNSVNEKNVGRLSIKHQMLDHFCQIVKSSIRYSNTASAVNGANRDIIRKYHALVSEYRNDAKFAETDEQYVCQIISGALKSSCGNCDEQSQMAAALVNIFADQYLKDVGCGISAKAELWDSVLSSDSTASGDHAICVVTFQEKGCREEWVLDPWYNIALPMREYILYTNKNPYPPYTNEFTTYSIDHELTLKIQNPDVLSCVEKIFIQYGITG